MSENKVYQPTNILVREAKHILNIAKRIGVWDFDLDHANDFQMYRLMYRVSREVEISLDEGVIKAPDDFKLNKTAIDNVAKMWHGGCYFAIERAVPENVRYFCTSYPKGVFDEVIPLPSLRNLVPIGKISDDSLFIQIREDMKLRYALEKISYATLISDGDMMHHLSDGTFPKIEPDEMKSMTKETHFIGRSTYNKIMESYDRWMVEDLLQLSVNFQKLIEYDKESGLSQFSELLGNQNTDEDNPFAIKKDERDSLVNSA